MSETASNAGQKLLHGNAWKFDDNIDTDRILPGAWLHLTEPSDIAAHCLEGADPKFAGSASPGDFIVAGSNFGCGSSREPATFSIKALGIGAVVAKSFSRIFLRNAITIGLPVIICDTAPDEISVGDELEIDLAAGTIKNLTTGVVHTGQEFPEFMQQIVAEGGIIPYAKRRIKERAAGQPQESGS
jgi:3-isopropylmalate/(R)-2-methylmalate dehydratase small subunit